MKSTHIAKKHIYFLIGFAVLIFIAAIAIAQTSAPNPGHAADEIGEGTIANALTIVGGNVGIGATSPRGRLQIGNLHDTLGLPTYPGDFILDGDPGGSNGIGGIEFRSSVSAGGAGWKITATGNYLGHKLLFAPRSAGATWETEVLALTQNGNVGIGTVNPKAKFEISEGGDNIRIFAHSMITDNLYYNGGWKNDDE